MLLVGTSIGECFSLFVLRHLATIRETNGQYHTTALKKVNKVRLFIRTYYLYSIFSLLSIANVIVLILIERFNYVFPKNEIEI